MQHACLMHQGQQSSDRKARQASRPHVKPKSGQKSADGLPTWGKMDGGGYAQNKYLLIVTTMSSTVSKVTRLLFKNVEKQIKTCQNKIDKATEDYIRLKQIRNSQEKSAKEVS